MDITEFSILMIISGLFFFLQFAKRGREFALFPLFSALILIYTFNQIVTDKGVTQYLGSTPTNTTIIPYNNVPFDLVLMLFIVLCFTFTILKLKKG